MKKKANRLDAIKMIISSKEIGSQEELLQALGQEGFELTQATLSRDLKQLKVAKAANTNGKYVYVLKCLCLAASCRCNSRITLLSSVPAPAMPAASLTILITANAPTSSEPLPATTPSC